MDISNALHRQLMKIGGVVDMFNNQDYDATDNWLQWLKDSENLLKTYNYSEMSLLAGLRANIIKEIKSVDSERNKRKRIVHQALSTVDEGQKVLFDINKQLLEKVNNVRTLIRQILIPAKEAGLINKTEIVDFTQYLESLLQQFKKHQQLAPSINNAVAMIGKFDVLRIIADEIDFS
ncbi:MAG: hypothetical protein LBB53_01985 [Prevotellaceae bacterium]|jgi:hypothetical protein|nr:hypothetical protein [Prevotellaceae bacterium]